MVEIVARACIAHADANQPFIEVHGDHEGVHQFRVAYRRLRSLFSLARDVVRTDPEAARLKAGLRELTVAFGPARDLDVFLEAHPYLTLEDSKRLDTARVRAYEQAQTFLDSAHWQQLRADLERWLDGRSYRAELGGTVWSGRATAARALERRWTSILADGAELANLDPHTRHKVRIEAKKVRYGSQFFSSLWPRAAADAALIEKRLGALQDHLGALNDAVTWASIETLAGLVDAEPPHVDVEAEIAAAQVIVDELSTITPYWRVSLRPKPQPVKPPKALKPAKPRKGSTKTKTKTKPKEKVAKSAKASASRTRGKPTKPTKRAARR